MVVVIVVVITDKAGVSQSSNPPTASAASGLVQVSPLGASDYPDLRGFVSAWYSGGGGFAGTFAFNTTRSQQVVGCTVWMDTEDSTRLCARDADTGCWYIYGMPEGEGAPTRVRLDVFDGKLSPSIRT